MFTEYLLYILYTHLQECKPDTVTICQTGYLFVFKEQAFTMQCCIIVGVNLNLCMYIGDVMACM